MNPASTQDGTGAAPARKLVTQDDSAHDFLRIRVAGSLDLGTPLKLVQLPAAEQAGDSTAEQKLTPAYDGWIGRRIEYHLVPSREAPRIAITDAGLVTGYGIFGSPGTGKTRLLLHILKDALNLSSHQPEWKYGGLLLDPKAAMVDEAAQMWPDLGPDRRGDLIIIQPDLLNDPSRFAKLGLDPAHQYTRLNVLDSALPPLELARMLVLAAQSAGVAAKEPFWFLAWTNLFAAALTLLEYFERRVPTVRDLVDAILLPDDFQQSRQTFSRVAGDGERYLRRIEVLADRVKMNGGAEAEEIHRRVPIIPLEQIEADLAAAAAQIESFFESDYVRTLEAFISNAFGAFQQYRFRCLSRGSRSLLDKYGSRPKRPSFYDSIIEQGKVVVVSVGPEDPGMGKTLCTLVKCLFQQAVMSRRERFLGGKLTNFKRPLFIACDEYSEIASEVPGQPMGDGRFFALARENGCMGLLATQSVHTLENSSLSEAWKSIFSNMAAKIFMGAADNETAKQASELAGTLDWEMASTSVSQAKEHSFSRQASFQQRPELTPYILTHVLKQRQAVAIGSLDGRSTAPALRFFQVPTAKPKAKNNAK